MQTTKQRDRAALSHLAAELWLRDIPLLEAAHAPLHGDAFLSALPELEHEDGPQRQAEAVGGKEGRRVKARVDVVFGVQEDGDLYGHADEGGDAQPAVVVALEDEVQANFLACPFIHWWREEERGESISLATECGMYNKCE